MSGLLVSCTATPGPGFNLASPSHTDVGIASMMADVAQSESANIVGEGGDEAVAANPTPAESGDEEALPQQVALLPAADPAVPPAQEPEKATAEAHQAAVEPDGIQAEAQAAATADEAVTAETTPEVVVETKPKKRSFLASLFSPAPNQAAPAAQAAFAPAKAGAAPLVSAPEEKAARLITPEPEEETTPLIDLSSKTTPVQKASFGGDALPGVRRQTNLFEITHKSGIEDDSDVDLYEGQGGPVILASAAGLARLAPNGLLRQRESVDVACLKPDLVRLLKTVERHFGKRMVITSGYRSPSYNRKVRGARRSQHMYCAAADVQIPGVSKWELAKLVRSMPSRGGVGTYCHTESVHIDVGPERDWNWRCRRRKS